MYIGDFRVDQTLDVKFTSRSFTTGAPTQLAGSPTVAAYPGNSTTEITAGITLSVDFDGRTGLNNVRVVATSGNGYATATNYFLVLTAGTVGGVSVVGEVVGAFSIEARSALMPTTAGRLLDVSAGGEAGLDWANIGSPTTVQTLSATTIDVDQVVASVSGNVTGSVGSMAANGIAATSIATGAITNTKFAAGAVDAAALAANAISDTKIATGAFTAAKFAAGAFDAVWTVTTRELTAFSTALALNVWHVLESAIVTASTIGLKLKTNVDAVLSTRSSQASVDAIGTAVDTEVAAIKAKTDQLTFTTANKVDATIQAAGDLAQAAADKVWASTTRTLSAFSTALAVSVWDVLASAVATANSLGLQLKTNVDAAISSRSTYAGADTAGTTTLLSRIIGTLATGTHQPQSGDSFARLGAPVGASLSADVAGVQADTDNLQTRLPTALINGRMLSDVEAINDNTTAAVSLGRSAATIVSGTVDTTAFTPTTTEFEADDVTTAATDHYKGRTLIVTSGTLALQATSISAYSLVGGRGRFTVVALTAGPADNVTFLIV